MGLSPGIGSWINQNTQQHNLKAESGNVKPNSTSKINTQEEERDEMKEQLKLWRDADKKERWHDHPPKVKVETRNDLEWGMCEMSMEFTLGLPPQAAYDVLTNPDNVPFSRTIKNRELLENTSRKVTSEDQGKGQIVETEKALSWNFLSLSGTIPLRLYFIEDPRELLVQYGIDKKDLRFMEMFEGFYKVKPIYVDSQNLCKHMKKPKTREEYIKCSGGQGRIASKVEVHQLFKPSSLFNLPPISWYIRRFIVKTTKYVVEDLQNRGAVIRGVEPKDLKLQNTNHKYM